MTEESWTPEKETLRKQLNAEYAKHRRDKTRVRKYGPKPKKVGLISEEQKSELKK
jgi:hypothetical protein